MILGFLGKGGSGKSSLSTQMTLWLANQHKVVLAIDADHNMDLSYNLSGGAIPDGMRYLGDSLEELQATVGLMRDEKYSEAFLRGSNSRFSFGIETIDPFTDKYSCMVAGARLMAAGPQTSQVLFGQSCSHILTTPLKIYLPLLELKEHEAVVVDEKAGADGVTTGIVTGIDVAVIVCEPALHSVKTAKQIAELLDFYDTPYVIAVNKVTSPSDMDFVKEHLEQEATVYFGQSDHIRRNPGTLTEGWTDHLTKLYEQAAKVNRNDRLVRTTKKFERNSAYSTS